MPTHWSSSRPRCTGQPAGRLPRRGEPPSPPHAANGASPYGLCQMEAAVEGDTGFSWHSSMVVVEDAEGKDSDREAFCDKLEPAVRPGGAGHQTLIPLQQTRPHQEAYAGNQISTLSYEAMPREQVSQEREQQIGMQTGLRDPSTATSRIQALLRRNLIVRSPLLKRRLMSPRIGQDAPGSTRKRKLRSAVWKEFEPIYQGNLIVQAKCIHCLDIFAAN